MGHADSLREAIYPVTACSWEWLHHNRLPCLSLSPGTNKKPETPNYESLGSCKPGTEDCTHKAPQPQNHQPAGTCRRALWLL